MIAPKATLEKLGIIPNKALGQNFIADENSVSRIAEIALVSGKNAIEIGSGLGTLTEYLCKTAKTVTAIEIDSRMAEATRTNLSNVSNLTVIRADFLKVVPSTLENIPTVAVGNLPYYITTPICLKLIQDYTTLENMTLMVQSEAAHRFFAPPGDRVYSILSVLTALYFDAKEEISLPKSAYYPTPDIDSTVVTFKRKRAAEPFHREFCAFIRSCFLMRRKTFLNNLLVRYEKDEILNALDKCALSHDIRAEKIPPEGLLAFFKMISNL
ncbi:MAG: 16S rRNA (adenine(1518)-N(6)/adenine(1519)-N(6))-dimethyltransferase RsmA [Clostridia bacterium]